MHVKVLESDIYKPAYGYKKQAFKDNKKSQVHSKHVLTCFSLLGLDLWLDVDQQGVQREAVRQDKIADVVATDTQRLQLSGFPVFQGHFHRLQVGVHAHVDTYGKERKEKSEN